jgi:hypothetical protein
MPRGGEPTLFVVRLSFVLPRLHVSDWARAAVRELEERGYRFPNLGIGRERAFVDVGQLRWAEQAATIGAPVFDEEGLELDQLPAARDELCVVPLHLDAPGSCAAWPDAGADFLLRMCKVYMRRHDYLRDLVPEVRAWGPWLALSEDGAAEPFYATETTTIVRRGMRQES